jgi:hypothetical protein
MLFAVLETHQCPALEPAGCASISGGVHDTLAIAGPDGYAKARTRFTARHIHPSGNAATVVDLEGMVAAGAAYFVDGSGTVRRMMQTGAVSAVATFPINSVQQSISFAVSPDGKQLIAAVLTYPLQTPPTDPNQPPWGTFSGPWRLQIERATAGASTTTLHQWQADTNNGPNQGFLNIWLVGWDALGPIALVGDETATQNAWLNNQRYFGGHLARLNGDGTVGGAIGPTDCLPYWRPTANWFACLGTAGGKTTVNIMDLSGRAVWTGTPPSGQYGIPGDFTLSADGKRLAMDGEVITLASNAVVNLAPTFQPQGWLDANTLIGFLPLPGGAGPQIGILRLSDPLRPESWGFSGAFVGLLSSSS